MYNGSRFFFERGDKNTARILFFEQEPVNLIKSAQVHLVEYNQAWNGVSPDFAQNPCRGPDMGFIFRMRYVNYVQQKVCLADIFQG